MTIYEAMINRHSVREYQDKAIEQNLIDALNQEIDMCNQESGLSIRLITGNNAIFKGLMAFIGGFRRASNCIALIGQMSDDLEEKAGYYGERIALRAQQLGLNTCWVGATYKKDKCRAILEEKERLVCVLALGYGTTQGVPHQSKPMAQLCKVDGTMPQWFQNGMKAAMLAPTAQNKQNFLISLNGEEVSFDGKEGVYIKVDLGIVKYHFQKGAVSL
ncbi:nitroreductase family protein [Oscillibacter sp.]|uniref:nitroreductase family protein n=1 Tax=Oscillibacter sp. TaxID=1945593 RepID=UPI00289A3EDE|nr:nitroreductase family protein [Oscillibacter sp.]